MCGKTPCRLALLHPETQSSARTQTGQTCTSTTLAADDPRYISWQNSYIYGDVQLTPAEFKEVSGVVQQATINDMSRQNTQKVKRDEQLYVTSHAQRMNELGFQHFQTKKACVLALGLCAKTYKR